MNKVKARSSLVCKASDICKKQIGVIEQESDCKKGKNTSTRGIYNLVLNKLKLMVLGIDFIDFSDNSDKHFEPYSQVVKNLARLNKNYPFELNDKSKIENLILEISSTDIERDVYLKNNFEIIKSLSGYLESDDYIKKVKEVESYLNENYFSIDLYPPINQFKEHLILDLDETLIHSETPIDFNKSYDFICIDEDIGIFVRNYVKEFVEGISNDYNLVLFSAGTSNYVNLILETVGIKDYFSLVLSRECCCSPFTNIYIKDVNVVANFLNRKIMHENNIIGSEFSKEAVIVDNNMLSFAKHLNNGVLVNDFIGTQDKELLDLYTYLIKLKNAKEDSNVSIEFLISKINQFIPLLKQIYGV